MSDQWITFQRFWSVPMGVWLAVQRAADGRSRTVVEK